MPWRTMATRSMPRPKANPVTSSGSYTTRPSRAFTASNTAGCTMPEPMISSHPVCLQTRQPLPPHTTQPRSTSTDGSVYGKYDGRKRTGNWRPEERVQEGLDGALQVAEGDPLAHDQAFDLLEHRRVRDVVVAAVDLARADDAHVRRVRVVQHVADLAARRVRAQEEPALREVERVLHVAGGMVRRHVEGLEAVVVVLHFGAVEDLVAHGQEDVFQVLAGRGQGMAAAVGRDAAGQRDVHALAGEAALLEVRFERVLRRLQRLLDLVLQAVQVLPGLASRVRGERAQRLHQGGDRPRLAAEVAVAQGLQGGRIPRRLQLAVEVRAQRADLVFQLAGPVAHEAMRPGRRDRLDLNDVRRRGPSRQADGLAAGDGLADPAAGAGRGRRLGRGHEGRERGLVAGRDVGQGLAVEVDARPLQPRDELAVRDLVGARGGVDADDPEPAEVPLLAAPSHVGEVARAGDGLLGRAVELPLGEEVPLGQGKDLLALLAALAAALDSRHVAVLPGRPEGRPRHAYRRRRKPGQYDRCPMCAGGCAAAGAVKPATSF